MLCIQFGGPRTITRHNGSSYTGGDYALHIQSPWRIVCRGLLVTGIDDLYCSSNGEYTGKQSKDCLFQTRIELLQNRVDFYGSVVQEILFDDFGGLKIQLENDITIESFACCSSNDGWEYYRFFKPGSDEDHLVFENISDISKSFNQFSAL
jgi:hypothetical protein